MNSEKLQLSIGPLFFDNFTSFRFHSSPNLLPSICLLNWDGTQLRSNSSTFCSFFSTNFSEKEIRKSTTQLQFILLIFQRRNYDGKIKTCLAFYTSVYKIQCQTVSYEKLCQIDLVCTNMRTNVDSKRATLW